LYRRLSIYFIGNPCGPNFVETKGLELVSSLIEVVMIGAFPDAVLQLQACKLRIKPDKSSYLLCKYVFSGTQISKIESLGPKCNLGGIRPDPRAPSSSAATMSEVSGAAGVAGISGASGSGPTVPETAGAGTGVGTGTGTGTGTGNAALDALAAAAAGLEASAHTTASTSSVVTATTSAASSTSSTNNNANSNSNSSTSNSGTTTGSSSSSNRKRYKADDLSAINNAGPIKGPFASTYFLPTAVKMTTVGTLIIHIDEQNRIFKFEFIQKLTRVG
jgi:hypothetical protein